MKNKPIIDLHTHTIASGHAYGTVRENALGAKEKGLSGLGISDHAYPNDLSQYVPTFGNMHAIPRELYGVNIYYGMENNVENDGSLTLDGLYLMMLDYCIVGIHGTRYQDQGIEKNTDHLLRCMEDPKVFFVSHPDDGAFPLDYERLVLGAKEHGVALEVNNAHIKSPWRKGTIENVRTYLDLCMKYRVPIFIGSDAHDPSQIGEFDAAVALLDEIGFDEDLILNNDEKKFRTFIGFKG